MQKTRRSSFAIKAGTTKWRACRGGAGGGKELYVSWTTCFYFDHKIHICKWKKFDTRKNEITSLFWAVYLLRYPSITLIPLPLYSRAECRRLSERVIILNLKATSSVKEAVSGSEVLRCICELRINDMWLGLLQWRIWFRSSNPPRHPESLTKSNRIANWAENV